LRRARPAALGLPRLRTALAIVRKPS
jgi:hypothetical protein